MARKPNTILPYNEAREFVRSLNLPNSAAWVAYASSGKRPEGIPANPWVAYKSYFDKLDKKFIINDFIGANPRRGRKPKAKVAEPIKSDYEVAKEIARGLNLKSRAEFTEMSKNKQRPEGIPARPDLAFKEKGWEGWAPFLGNVRETVNA
jgi:hypothetical protein